MNEQQFRQDVADWMATHLVGRFACLKHRGGPGDEEAFPALRKEWEQELAAGGWVGATGADSTWVEATWVEGSGACVTGCAMGACGAGTAA